MLLAKADGKTINKSNYIKPQEIFLRSAIVKSGYSGKSKEIMEISNIVFAEYFYELASTLMRVLFVRIKCAN